MQARPYLAAVFDYDIEHCSRHGEEYKRIVVPGGGNVAVQQTVESALAAATGAFMPGDKSDDASGSTPGKRVVRVIIPTKNGGYSEHNCCRSRHAVFRVFHFPKRLLVNITGRKPRAMAIMISHAAISDAFLAFSTLPF